MSEQPILRLVSGDGLVARRATELLFLPTGSTALLDTFREAERGEGLEAVTELCEAQDFQLDDFVVLDWSSGLRVAVFGDVELTSNQKSLPRLSGTDAGTWVERTLRKIDGTIEIGVSTADRIEATDLADGCAQAGGFALILRELSAVERTQQRRSGFREMEPVDPTRSATSGPPAGGFGAVSELETGPDEPVHSEPDTGVDGGEPLQSEQPRLRDRDASVSDLTDLAGDPAPDAAKVAAELLGVMNTGDPTSNPYAVGPEDDTVVPTPEMRSIVDSLVSTGTPDVAPPDSGMPQWQLRMVDGEIEVLDRDLILGRNPQFAEDDGPDDARLVPLAGTNLSRSHLRVVLRNAAVFLTDLGSTNGSFIVTTGDGQLVQLESHNERRVDTGTIVQIGSVRFFVESMSGK